MHNARARAFVEMVSVAPYYDTVTMMLVQDISEALTEDNTSRAVTGIAGIVSLFVVEGRVGGLTPFMEKLEALYELCITDSITVEVTSVRGN